MFLSSVKFIQSVNHWEELHPFKKPHIALAGRSNSGKSSFINSLTGQKTAKVSRIPGKTRSLNIFGFKNLFFLVDMPGYGYGARSHKERKEWKKMVDDYLLNSPFLKGMILFMDIRRQWSQEEDQIVTFSRAINKEIVIVLTKMDKFSFSQQKQKKNHLEKTSDLPCFAISSLKKQGTQKVINYIIRNWI